VSVEDDEHSGRSSTSKKTENIEKFENSSTKTIAEQSMNLHTPLGSVLEFAWRSNKKFEHAPHCCKVVLTNDQSSGT
jgi:hypothetical protein